MSRRLVRGVALLAGLGGALLVTSCSSSPAKPNTVASSFSAAQHRAAKYEPALVACFASHHLIPARDLKNQSWYKAGKVRVNDAFVEWWREHEGLAVHGEELSNWLHYAAVNGTWPTSICGPAPAA